MRKFFLFLVCIICIASFQGVSANWYTSSWYSYIFAGGTSWCPTDGDTTGGSPVFNGSPVWGNYTHDSRVVGLSGGSMRCELWDGASPDSLSVTYTTGWTNSSKGITYSVRDRGGSRLKRVVLQQSTNGGGWANVQDWDNLGDPNGTMFSRTWIRSAVNGSSFSYRIVAYDYAGNSSTYTNSGLIQFDTTPPSGYTLSPLAGTYLLANNSRNIQISVAPDGGSPIATIRASMEGHNTPGSYSTAVTQTNPNPFSANFNMSLVDNERNANNYREYSLQVQQVCDQAGNCMTGLPIVSPYYVYASGVQTITPATIPVGLTNSSIADGSNNQYSFSLRDLYGNVIVPVRRVDSSVMRSLDFAFNHSTHTLGTNQYDESSIVGGVEFEYDSSVQQPDKGDISTNFVESSALKNTGNYNFDIRVFAPTGLGDSHAKGDFTIDSVNVTLSDSGLGTTILDGTEQKFSFRGIYNTVFSGQLKQTGFIEGATQNSSLGIFKNTPINPVSPRLYLEFGSGSSNQPSSGFSLEYGKTDILGTTAVEGNQSTGLSGLAPQFHSLAGTQTLDIFTLLSQQAAVPVSALNSSYFATHIQYTLGGKLISYSSDIIGKGNYHGSTVESNTTQQGIKILGQTSSDKNQELVLNQFTDDVRIIGKLTKSSHKRDISKKTFDLIRSVTADNGSNRVTNFGNTNGWNTQTPASGKKLLSDSVLYFGDMTGEYVELGNGSSQTISGNKTLVIVGGDAYITSNLTNGTSSSILGIIVLSDSAGNGGNVYVHPDVTDISAVIYTDKAIMSATDYNSNGTIEPGTSEIHGSSTPITTLANQLYIYGSIFSENTIGGSRASPTQCPYYITSCSSAAQAQPYDLNYIRRYAKIDDDNSPLTPLVIANGGSASAGATSYPNYPMIIEYNSSIQSNPPALFK